MSLCPPFPVVFLFPESLYICQLILDVLTGHPAWCVTHYLRISTSLGVCVEENKWNGTINAYVCGMIHKRLCPRVAVQPMAWSLVRIHITRYDTPNILVTLKKEALNEKLKIQLAKSGLKFLRCFCQVMYLLTITYLVNRVIFADLSQGSRLNLASLILLVKYDSILLKLFQNIGVSNSCKLFISLHKGSNVYRAT